MAVDTLRSGLGYIESGTRYGYTDGKLWYLGECRIYTGPAGDRDFVALSYDDLRRQVDGWIAASPANRDTKPTANETRCLLGFQGSLLVPPVNDHRYYFQNYFYCGKPDPQPYALDRTLSSVFSYPALGITGIGYGYADGYHRLRQGFSDSQFWYRGESRLFVAPNLPSNAREVSIPSGGPAAATGIKYYQTADANRYYITSPETSAVFLLLDYSFLSRIVDEWEAVNHRPLITSGAPDVLTSGFLWMGQSYWQTLGYQCTPDELVIALRDSERNLQTLIRWLPSFKAQTTGQISVAVPKLSQGLGGLSLTDILALQYLSRGNTKKSRRRKRR